MQQTILTDFASQYPLRSFKKNETIFFQDDQPTTVYYIKSGFVKGYDIDSQGSEQLLWLGAAGDFFPVMWAFGLAESVPYFFNAFTNLEAYAIPRVHFRNFLDTSHEALLEFTDQITTRLFETYRHLNAAEKARTEEKVAHSLLFLASRFGGMANETVQKITLPVTHQDIARLIGLSRETVTQELKKFKELGYIYYDKDQFIIYPDKLQTII